jgi:hypothetical protein
MISLQNTFNMTTIVSNDFLESNTNVCDDITTQVFCNLDAPLDKRCSSVHEVCRYRWKRLTLQETPQNEVAWVQVGAKGWPKMAAVVSIRITV